MSDTTPATETANTPGPADSSGEPSNPPDAQQGRSTQAQQQGTEQQAGDDDAKIDQAFDPSQPPYTGGDEAKDKDADRPEAEPGGLPEQTPPT